MPRASFRFRNMQNAMKNPAPAPGLSKAEAQRSFQRQHRGKLLQKVSPFFPHGSVFPVPSPRKLWLPLALPFLKYAIHHPLQGVLFTKRAFFFVFPGRKACLGLTNRDKAFGAEHLNAAEPACALGAKGEDMCYLRGPKDMCLAPSNRVSLSGWGVWGSCNELGANNELLRTSTFFQKWFMQCIAWFCGKSLQAELFSEVQVAFSDCMLKNKDYGIHAIFTSLMQCVILCIWIIPG